jgi:hypothetical protein
VGGYPAQIREVFGTVIRNRDLGRVLLPSAASSLTSSAYGSPFSSTPITGHPQSYRAAAEQMRKRGVAVAAVE